MKIRHAILAIGAATFAVSAYAQQAGGGGQVPAGKQGMKAGTQATVQGGGQGGGQGQMKAGTASKKGTQATVQGGGQGGGTGQHKAGVKVNQKAMKSGTQATVQGGGQGGQGGGQLKSGAMSKGAAIKDSAKAMK